MQLQKLMIKRHFFKKIIGKILRYQIIMVSSRMRESVISESWMSKLEHLSNSRYLIRRHLSGRYLLDEEVLSS